jgi:hypothetical protein
MSAHGCSRNSEVDHARQAVASDKNVVRAHVAVHDTEWLSPGPLRLVRLLESAKDAGHERANDGQRDALLTPGVIGDESGKGFTGYILHDEKELVVVDHNVDDGHYVRVSNTPRDFRFVHEHRDELCALRQIRVQALDGYCAREAIGANKAPEVDRRHPARR